MTRLTESERAALPLAPGSRWEGAAVVDDDRVTAEVSYRPGVTPGLNLYDADVRESAGAWIPDVLAVIRAAGLDPVWEAARKLVEAIDKRHELDFYSDPEPGHESYVNLGDIGKELEALRSLVKP